MANICISIYRIEGETADITALYNLMSRLRDTKENGNWVGHIIEELSGGVIPNHIYPRGWWSELKLESDNLTFQLESAWESLHDTWDYICSKFESLSAYFSAEEPGCEIYVKRDNDAHDFPDNYFLDACTPEGEYHSEYFTDINDAHRYIEKIADVNIITEDDIVALNRKWQEDEEDAYIYLHEFTEV